VANERATLWVPFSANKRHIVPVSACSSKRLVACTVSPRKKKMTHRTMQMTGLGSLMKEGTQHLSGLEEAVLRNIEACKQLAQITRTSLGPNGLSCFHYKSNFLLLTSMGFFFGLRLQA
jgi:hypothetical protein